ncbi:aryl hydrocarbon receptor-like isoform X2 [Salvelinus alpinus]|uniref:aryl hydrocarbon receptor-like isoform X2 n=1 Tax=Salvelinus alpinus TaxID=8036 RepID=UPI0039FCAC4E
MLGDEGIYAAKKRKKPVQKSLTPAPGDGVVMTNTSKCHRDRLNGELDRLTGLLPFSQEVRGRLDKLAVLRLSVGYLKVKSFFHATLQKKSEWPAALVNGNGRTGWTPTSIDGVSLSEGILLLQALNGFVLVVTTDGSIFYASPTIQDYLRFHQEQHEFVPEADAVRLEIRHQVEDGVPSSQSHRRKGGESRDHERRTLCCSLPPSTETNAMFKTTGNSDISDFSGFRTTGNNWEFRLGEIVLNGHPTRNSKSETQATF